ncbi:MAG: VOC family protein [Pseudomonadota bacterium]
MRHSLPLVVFVTLLSVFDNLAAETKAVERLAPVHRHSILVSDLDRSLTLYRDILGMTLSRVSDTSSDSYSYVFFNIEPGAMKRFAYLNGEGGQRDVLGLAEVPGFSRNDPDGLRAVAWVQTVEDVEGALSEAANLGLQVIPPIEFMSREAGKPGLEGGIIDFDGHLILIYGLTRASIGLPPVNPKP